LKGIEEPPFQSRYYSLSNLYDAILKKAHEDPCHPLFKKKELCFSEAKELAEKEDPLVLAILEKAARLNAIRLLAITNLLDLDDLLLGGRMVEFGDAFKKPLERYYHILDANHNTAQILYSKLRGQAGLLGAAHQISNLYFLDQCEKIIKDRTSSPAYDAKKFFGDSL